METDKTRTAKSRKTKVEKLLIVHSVKIRKEGKEDVKLNSNRQDLRVD